MSARRATTGESWDTLLPRTMATTPVLANGYSYSTPIRSSSARMSVLVFTSSYWSSGCSWMLRLTRFIHSTVSGCRASWSINLLLSLDVVATPKLPNTNASNINSRSRRSNVELAILTCNSCASGGLITPTLLAPSVVKIGRPASISQHNPQQFHGWKRTERLVRSGYKSQSATTFSNPNRRQNLHSVLPIRNLEVRPDFEMLGFGLVTAAIPCNHDPQSACFSIYMATQQHKFKAKIGTSNVEY